MATEQLAAAAAHATFLGLTAGAWVAFWTAILALATIALVIATVVLARIALRQMRTSQMEARQWQTLSVCDRYETDPAPSSAACLFVEP
jgi:hypothetical protein